MLTHRRVPSHGLPSLRGPTLCSAVGCGHKFGPFGGHGLVVSLMYCCRLPSLPSIGMGFESRILELSNFFRVAWGPGCSLVANDPGPKWSGFQKVRVPIGPGSRVVSGLDWSQFPNWSQTQIGPRAWPQIPRAWPQIPGDWPQRPGAWPQIPKAWPQILKPCPKSLKACPSSLDPS